MASSITDDQPPAMPSTESPSSFSSPDSTICLPSLASLANTVEARLSECERVVHYGFRDRQLLERCLTHASIARTRLDSNERLEFLGDAILGALTCELLYERFPEETEGELTRIKSVVVSRTTCARISQRIGLDRCLILGKGLSIIDQVPVSVIAAVFESVVAGIYLDGGWDAVRPLVRDWLESEIDRVVQTTHGKNYKSLLQQIAQKSLGSTPTYRLLDEKGPDHSKCFKVAATVAGETYPSAWGPNKKEAEQRAAENAWCHLQGRPLPYTDGSADPRDADFPTSPH